MRLARILLGLLILLGAGAVIVGEQLSGASANAVINARLTTLQAPIAGELAMSDRALGTLVAEGERIARVSDPLVDDTRLEDLVLEQGVSEAQRSRLEAQVRALDESLVILSDRAQQYGRRRMWQIDAEIDAAQSSASAAEARLEEAQGTLRRAQQLSERGVTTAAAFDEATADARVAERVLDQSHSEMRVLEIQLEAAGSGIFLGDSYNDAPYSEQRATELQLRRRELEADLEEVTARSAFLSKRVMGERRRVNRLAEAVVQANVRGRLWEVLASDGERLQRGQPLARLVNCNSTIVTLSVAEAVYNRLQVGDEADFRVNGESSVYKGIVSRLAGTGAAAIYGNLAIAPSQEHLERFDVTLLVPGLRADPVLGCAVGRTGRAFFEARPLDWLRTTFAGLVP